MKSIFFILAYLCVGTFSYGQSEIRRFTYTTTIGTGIAINFPSQTPFSWQLLGHYNLTSQWAVGGGTGISVYEKPLLPLFADVKYKITKSRKITPYVECAGGYSFALAKKTIGGFYLSPTVGIEYPFLPKMSFLFGLGYELQKLQRLIHYEATNFTSEFQERFSHHSITFKIGVKF